MGIHEDKMGRKPIVGGNWKCNPAETAKLPELVANFKPCADLLDKCDVYVCPSNLHVGMIYQNFAPGIMVAPQNCNFKGCGAYTGEMAVDQMVDMGLKCCLIGHSERRGEFGLPTPKESNELMATKLAYILDKGLMCVFCIGEPLPIREKGIDAVLAECVSQLKDIVPILCSSRLGDELFNIVCACDLVYGKLHNLHHTAVTADFGRTGDGGIWGDRLSGALLPGEVCTITMLHTDSVDSSLAELSTNSVGFQEYTLTL